MNCKTRIQVFNETLGRYISVPCSKCIECLHKKRNEWTFRLLQEHKYSSSAYFITLTYGPYRLPEDGKVNKRHVQLFMKKLRKHFNDTRLRYFAVGEYGSKYGRPHYHILLFNADDLNETILKKTWEYGYAHIGRVTQASVMYCTKYVIQRSAGFTLMSRKYGIGGMYLTDQMVAWHRKGERNYVMNYNQMCSLPRFYKDKIWRKEELERLGQKWLWQGIRRDREDMRRLLKQGYGTKQVQEMRNAWASRIKEKIAYTQTF